MNVNEILVEILEKKKKMVELKMLYGLQRVDLMVGFIQHNILWIENQQPFDHKCFPVMNLFMLRQSFVVRIH